MSFIASCSCHVSLLACWETQNPCSNNTLDEIKHFIGNSGGSAGFLVTASTSREVDGVGGIVSETTRRNPRCLGSERARRHLVTSGCQQRIRRCAQELKGREDGKDVGFHGALRVFFRLVWVVCYENIIMLASRRNCYLHDGIFGSAFYIILSSFFPQVLW